MDAVRGWSEVVVVPLRLRLLLLLLWGLLLRLVETHPIGKLREVKLHSMLMCGSPESGHVCRGGGE
jgi:hypothetical protein